MRYFAWMLLVVLGGAMTFGATTPLTLSQAGKAQALIVVATEAAESENHAAGELSKFLKQVTGAEFKIINHYSEAAPCLLVGPGAARLADKNFSTVGLGQEGLVIRTVGKDLILAGGRPRGTLYAVYTFLEDYVGCRWWAPGESTIPRKPALEVSPLNIRYVPVMEMREPYWYVTNDGDWCVRNKVNGGRTYLDARRGSKFHEIGGCHSFYIDIPPDKYFKDHPEWFSEIGGKRTASNAQLCMTNKDLIQEYARIIRSNLRTKPKNVFFNYIADRTAEDVSAVWVSQNDWGGYCECKNCKRINDREKTPAGALLQFVNAIAEEVEKEFPQVAVYTYAYEWSQKPPKTIVPRKNVVIWLCTTGCKYNVPYTHPINRTFFENFNDWSKICGRIYIWDYVTNFAAYLCPHLNLRTLGPNIRYFAAHSVRGVFAQGAAGVPGAEMAALRAWVAAKLLWNPSLDGQKLIDEFLDGYFGPASKPIRASLNVFHDAIERTGESIYMCEQPMGKKWLSLETLSEGMKHLRAARSAAAGNKDLERRVQIAELPLIYVFLMRWDEFYERAKAEKKDWPFGDRDIKQVYDQFQTARKKYGITQVSEGNARDWFSVVEERVAVGKALVPPGCEKLPRDRWVDLQDVGLDRNKYITSKVKDKDASDGSAVFMPATSEDKKPLYKQLWRVPLVTLAAAAKKPLRVYLSVRCETTGKEGLVFKCGVDGKDRVLEVKAADIADNRYHTYELGKFDDLTGWIILWVAPGNNPKNVKGIWLDRIWLVAE